jgi:hypothetical protein
MVNAGGIPFFRGLFHVLSVVSDSCRNWVLMVEARRAERVSAAAFHDATAGAGSIFEGPSIPLTDRSKKREAASHDEPPTGFSSILQKSAKSAPNPS